MVARTRHCCHLGCTFLKCRLMRRLAFQATNFARTSKMNFVTVRKGICRLGRLCMLAQRSFHTAPATLAGGKWRLKQGEGGCGNEYGPLRDIPDWSYADGRPAPPTQHQLARQQEQVDMCERIVQLTKEIKFAKENHQRKVNQANQHRQSVLAKKLKPKVL